MASSVFPGATDGLTDTQLRASPVPVTGTVTSTGGLTDAELRATPVPVSGTVTTGGLTDTQLRASAVPVTSVLTAGSALVGKVGIDQTTPGTTNAVGGDVAAGATDSSNPLKMGGKAASAAPTAVTAGQRVNGLFDLWGRQHVRTGLQAPVASTFTQVHVPATNVQATKTQASAGAGKRNVCTGFTVTLTAGASAITAAAPITVAVIDGAAGGTTYLWRSYVNIPASAGVPLSINRSGLWLVGSQATAMTVEFSGAAGTNSYESIAFDGVVLDE